MQVKHVATHKPEFIDATTSIQAVAEIMRETGCGCLPVGDDSKQKLVGIVTDRDIVLKAVAQGKDLGAKVSDIATEKVFYCFEDDEISDILHNMKQHQIQRLVVLKDQSSKQFRGMITLSDIAKKCTDGGAMSEGIAQCCKPYH